MKDLVPFGYFERDNKAFCPKCSKFIVSAYDRMRTICTGGFSTFWTCPKIEHFHHKCKVCGGKWIEATFESEKEESLITIKRILQGFLKKDISEEELVQLYREMQVKEVMND